MTELERELTTYFSFAAVAARSFFFSSAPGAGAARYRTSVTSTTGRSGGWRPDRCAMRSWKT